MDPFALTEQELADGFKCVTEDGGIKKKMITESKTPELGSPPHNSKVICHYTGTLPDQNDEKFDSSRDRDDPFTFKIGNGRVIKGWDEGVATMKKGERCILRCASPYAYGENGSPPKIPGGATLDFDVELIDWDDWEECDGSDNKISKRVVIPSDAGFDDDVVDDAVLTMTYRGYWVEDKVDHICVERKDCQITVGDDDCFPEAFHTMVKSMKKGEKAMFKIKDNSVLNVDDVYVDPEELKSNELNNNKVLAPSGKTMIYEVMIHEMKKGKEKWNAENGERIEEGFRYKEAGNAMFKGQRYPAAIRKYEKALEWVDVDFSDDEMAKKKMELTITANNNMALLYSKMKEWSAATGRLGRIGGHKLHGDGMGHGRSLSNPTNQMKDLQTQLRVEKKESILWQQRYHEKESHLIEMEMQMESQEKELRTWRGERSELKNMSLTDLQQFETKLISTLQSVRVYANRRYENECQCTVCCENPNNMVLVPCGHRLCGECIQKVRKCPMCRAGIKQTVQIK